MNTVFDRWSNHQAAVAGTRFHHFIFSHDPFEAYHRIIGVASAGYPRTSARVTPYDVARMHDLIARQGFTHHPHEADPAKHGYSASLDHRQGGLSQVFKISDMTPDHIATHREQGHKLFDEGSEGHKVFQGGWYDRDAGNVYLDTSHVHHDEGQVRDFGIKHKQKAYYDLGRNEEVFYHPSHDPEYRGENGHDAQQSAIAKYSRVAHTHGKVTPEGYSGYAHEYPLPEHAKPGDEARSASLKHQQYLRQYAHLRYERGLMSDDEAAEFEAESARNQIRWDNLGHL